MMRDTPAGSPAYSQRSTPTTALIRHPQATMLVDGGTRISDLAVLRNQPLLFGEVASTPTAWRTLEAVDADALGRIAAARAQVRRAVWAGGADPGFYVIDMTPR